MDESRFRLLQCRAIKSIRYIITYCFSLPIAIPAAASSNTLPDAVQAALAQNGNAVDAIAIEWNEETVSLLPLQTLKSQLNVSELDGIVGKVSVRYTRNGTSFRYTAHDSVKLLNGNSAPRLMEATFNGDILCSGMRLSLDEGKTFRSTLGISEYPKLNSVGIWGWLDYFECAGYWAPTEYSRLTEKPGSLVLHLLDTGYSLEPISNEVAADGGELRLTLSSPEFSYDFVLSVAHSYAVKRFEQRLHGKTVKVVTNSDFRKLDNSTKWLPFHCSVLWNVRRHFPDAAIYDAPILSTQLLVRSARSIQAPESEFVLDYSDEPGAVIGDTRIPGAEQASGGRIYYDVPASGDSLEEAVQKGIRKTLRPTEVEGASAIRLWLIGGNAIFIIVIICLMAMRHRARARER